MQNYIKDLSLICFINKLFINLNHEITSIPTMQYLNTVVVKDWTFQSISFQTFINTCKQAID